MTYERPTRCGCGHPNARPPCTWCTDYARACEVCGEIVDMDEECDHAAFRAAQARRERQAQEEAGRAYWLSIMTARTPRALDPSRKWDNRRRRRRA
jgi:hypothetical protein